MMKFGRSSMVASLAASAMLALAGCSGAEETPTPTATPTPTPTPTPMNDTYRVTSMAVGNASQGVDLNGDNVIDNGIEDALDEVSTTIYDAVETALTEAGLSGPQLQAIMGTVEQILNSVFTVEALSSAINGPIESGDINYLLNFKETSTGVTLTWNTGTFKNTGYTVGQKLGEQAGSLENGAGLFGPGDLTLTLSFASPNGESSTDVELVIAGGYTAVSGYNGTLINNALSGGAISIQFLLDLVESALTAIQEAIDNLPENPNGSGSGSIVIPIDDILTQLDTALTEQADLDSDLNGTNDAFSIGLVVNGDIVTVVQ